MWGFIKRQYMDISQGPRIVLLRKMKIILMVAFFGIYVVAIIRLIKPWLLVRFGELNSSRIGHFAANTELYFCERDAGINVPTQRYLDIFYFVDPFICNAQLATMWRRVLNIWPRWMVVPIVNANRLIHGGKSHEVGNNTQNDRDVHNLLDQFPPHLQFTDDEIVRGEKGLRAIGIPAGASFVCLIVRDSEYLDAFIGGRDWSYHSFRDSHINNYVLAAEELANRGYFVVRMGAKVKEAMKNNHPRVIDYATNGKRSDFMDIYLGAKCAFCISVSTGFDSVPFIFRRPIVFVNMVPIGYLRTCQNQFLGICKHHFLAEQACEMSLTQIFNYGVGFSLNSSDFESTGIELIENTPEEIRDIVVEMDERLNGTWQTHEEDETLQTRFWKIFPTNAVDSEGKPLHGEIRAHFGASFLRNNQCWLQ